MSDNERILLEKSKKGDVEAFEQLIESYQKKIFNIAFRMTGNYNDAGELTQEVLVRVFRSIKSFREEASLSTWIYRITTNTCLDELRKRKNKKVISLEEEIKTEDGELRRQIVDAAPSPEELAERNEIKRCVDAAVRQLPDEQRTMIILRDIQGFSYDEISRILKCPQGTVKSRISRARLALRDILKNSGELFNASFVK